MNEPNEPGNEFVPSRVPDPVFPGQVPPGYDPLSVEAPRVPAGFQMPEGGPVPPRPDDPRPGRAVGPVDALPDPGDFSWETRFFAPGLDLSAIDRHAVHIGALSALVRHEPTGNWLDVFKGDKDASTPLAGFMLHAFASAFDNVCGNWAGRTVSLDHKELLSLLAFGYAACVRLAESHPDVFPPPVRPEPREYDHKTAHPPEDASGQKEV